MIAETLAAGNVERKVSNYKQSSGSVNVTFHVR